MATLSIHQPATTRAMARHHPVPAAGGAPFTCLTIATDQANVQLFVPIERAAWAEQVAAAINAPVPAEVAA